jgi:PIN domain nuclease of toxin-antitoxin system
MAYLLDTHILLWWLDDSPRLSRETREFLGSPRRTFFVSSATAWEIAIKKRLGKLSAPEDLEEAIKANGFESLPITIPHALATGTLPLHHEDPFDRMLIAQASVERLILVTHDRSFARYSVAVKLV